MPLAFRNLTTDPSEPVANWPTEAVQAALERGDLADWHRLATEVGRHPWGRTARQIEEVLRYSRPYGVAEAMEMMITRARERVEQRERQEVAAEIRWAVDESGLTRAEFASRIGTSASRLSTYLAGSVVPSATLLVRIRRNCRDAGSGWPPHPNQLEASRAWPTCWTPTFHRHGGRPVSLRFEGRNKGPGVADGRPVPMATTGEVTQTVG
jgi:DNA-binding transcriptional regulator YiaG